MAKTAQVLIEGLIDPYSYTASITGIRDSLSWQGQFDEIEVTINSNGGDIAEGLGMYDQLRSYEVPIRTIVIGQCCSAATIVFLAGKTRLIFENVVAFMVHQASAEPYGSLTADQARTLADLIDGYNDRMSKIYMEATGADAETVAVWISKDTFMSAAEAVANKFATGISSPIKARFYARLKPEDFPQSNSSTSKIDYGMKIIRDQFKRIMASVNARLNNPVVEAKKVTTSTGEELDIEYAGDSMAEGDPVNKNGEPAPDGEYTIDGIKVTVKDGKVEKIDTGDTSTDTTAEGDTTVTASNEDEDEEDEATELVRLRAENSDLKSRVSANEKSINTISAQMKVLLGSKESPDPKLPAPKGTQKKVQARATEVDDEEQERQDALDERKAKGYGITVEQLREREGR